MFSEGWDIEGWGGLTSEGVGDTDNGFNGAVGG